MDMTESEATPATPDTASAPNLFALAAGITGLLGMFVLPILLGPAAIALGIVGWVNAKGIGCGRGAAVVGVGLGILTLVALNNAAHV